MRFRCIDLFPTLVAHAHGEYSGPLVVYYESAPDTPSDAVGIEIFRKAVAEAVVTNETKVWAEGMSEWQPFGGCKATFGF